MTHPHDPPTRRRQLASYRDLWGLVEVGSDGSVSYLSRCSAQRHAVEPVAGGPQVRPAVQPAAPMTQDQWRIADPMREIIARQSVNDVDHGVFVAPPV